jgi:hypothetical protein
VGHQALGLREGVIAGALGLALDLYIGIKGAAQARSSISERCVEAVLDLGLRPAPLRAPPRVDFWGAVIRNERFDFF